MTVLGLINFIGNVDIKIKGISDCSKLCRNPNPKNNRKIQHSSQGKDYLKENRYIFHKRHATQYSFMLKKEIH